MLEMDSVRLRWKEKKGRLPTADDAERIYQKSLAATLDVLPNNSHVITGLLSSVSFSHINYLQFKISQG